MKKLLSLLLACVLLCGCTSIENDVPAFAESAAAGTSASSGVSDTSVFSDIPEISSVSDTAAQTSAAVTSAAETSADKTDVSTGSADTPTLALITAAPPETSATTAAKPEVINGGGIAEPDGETHSVRLLCAGDNLIHKPIYRIANETAGGNGYDFSPAYENLGTLISDADLAILNQETIISDDFAPDTYPTFCTPGEMAKSMIGLGFDAISVSNNHVLDKGEKGLISTLGFWSDNYPDIPVYGAYLNDDDMNDIRTLEVNGIKFAFLGYMEHTNGLFLPAGSPCRITYLSDEDTIRQQVRRASQTADCVVVSVHFGIEVSNLITEQQRTFSQKLADWGADIIIGTQPHTVQSMQYLTAADGREAFVFYCLGNFISAMDNPLSMAEMLGELTVTKNPSGDIILSDPAAIPLVNYYNSSYTYVGVYPLDKYTRELAGTHGLPGATYDFILGVFRNNLPGDYVPEPYKTIIFGE